MRSTTREIDSEIIDRVAKSEGLPALSSLAIRLVELASDDESSAGDLAAIIEKDPGLTTRLLKLAGSAFFSRPVAASSVSQAVVLLGFKRVRIMALGLSLRDAFRSGNKKIRDHESFWRSSLYRALIAQDLARLANTRELDPDEAFVAGLILEIGIPMLYQVCSFEPEMDFSGGSTPFEDVVAWQEKNLGFNHRELGCGVLERWRFPGPLIESQRYFGSDALDPERPAIVRVAELARRSTEIFFSRTKDIHELQSLIGDTFGVDHEATNKTLTECFDKVESIAAQLNIQVDSQKDILEIMERANRALSRITSMMEDSFDAIFLEKDIRERPDGNISKDIRNDDKKILENALDAVAHEIRNPLVAIGGFARRLSSIGDKEAQGRRYADIIAKECARLEQVLNEMTEYSKTYDPLIMPTELISIIDSVIEEFHDVFRERNVHLGREFPLPPLFVMADEVGITRALRQFLSNSIGSIGNGQASITVSVRPSGQNGRVSISIKDNGVPLPSEVRDALLDSNLSAKTFGRGLELPMVRRIIEHHNGNIELHTGNNRNEAVFDLQPARP